MCIRDSLYTDQDLERLDVVLNLSREMGVNLAGIEIILNMRDKMSDMQRQMEQFMQFVRQELAPALRSAQTKPSREAIVRVGPPRVIRVHK